MKKYLMGLDNGGTMVKAALYDLEGHEVALASRKVEMLRSLPGHTERDCDVFFNANIEVIKEVLEKSGVKGEEVIGMAITGHGNGVYLVKEDGSTACNGIISTDSRAKDYVEMWYEDGTAEKVLPFTMQSVWAGQPIPILRWFKDNDKKVLDDTKWVFSCKDYVRFRLTGEAYGEITDMSGSGLMNVKEARYDADLLKEFGLQECIDKLPPLKSSEDICGYITKEIADITGLKEGTPVAGGSMDTHVSAIATGAVEKDKLCIVAGTWSINEYVDTVPVIDKDLFMTSFFPIDGHYLIMEASPTSASNLEWYLSEIMKDIKLEEGTSIYELSNELVQSVEADEANIIFLPFLYGTNVDANAKASFIGLNGWHTRAHVLRALYEGVVFSHRSHIDKLLKYRDKPQVARIAGGVVNSKVWVQMFADILQIPIEVVKTKELGALGSAICAGIAVGEFESFKEATDKMVEVDYVCKPDPSKKDIYDKKYDLYKKIIEALDPIWKEF
ncbi:MAG: carbohydrate kinase [Clostridiales bacterium]|mgnify:CR=1 FL=1|nr:carbohydrate kinase [Clostridiales bacterium]